MFGVAEPTLRVRAIIVTILPNLTDERVNMAHGYPSNPKIEQAIIDLLFLEGGENHEMRLSEIYPLLADNFNLTEAQRTSTSVEVTGRGENRSYWENLVRTAKARLTERGVLAPKLGNGICRLVETTEVSLFVKQQDLRRTNSVRRIKETANQKLIKSPDTPIASDFADIGPAQRAIVKSYRILRDTAVARDVKIMHSYMCQICDDRIEIGSGKYYAEVHHIKPLGIPHNGPDIRGNVICVCPNHHVQLDYGVIPLNKELIKTTEGHEILDEYIEYHNKHIYKKIID